MSLSVGRNPASFARKRASTAEATHGETHTNNFAPSTYSFARKAYFTAQNAGPPMIASRPSRAPIPPPGRAGKPAATNP